LKFVNLQECADFLRVQFLLSRGYLKGGSLHCSAFCAFVAFYKTLMRDMQICQLLLQEFVELLIGMHEMQNVENVEIAN
jgi:hypothetical protein